MNLNIKILIFNVLVLGYIAKDKPDLRGVPPNKLKKYTRLDNKFACFSDPSKVMDISVVNDDYCDCEDGSDEPGTSACPNSTFYCENKGFKPAYIKSSRVNDGICDEECCDGSDEYDGKVSCPNRCKELGKAAKEELAKKKELLDKGLKKKQEYIGQYGLFKKNLQDQIDNIKKEIEEAKLKVVNLKKIKEEKETAEAKANDNHQNNAANRADALEAQVVNLKSVAQDLQDKIIHLETVLKDLKLNHNQNYHDMAVKGAIKSYDEFVEQFQEINFETDERFKINDPEAEARDATNQDAANARTELWNAESEVTNKESSLKTIEDKLNMNYGPEGAFAYLNEKCFDKTDGDYVYTVCMFGDVHQKSKNGENIHLGKFSKWNDENYTKQDYTEGTYCWNGPQRSVKLSLSCGVEELITEITEPEKCEYHIHMYTPAACQNVKIEQASVEPEIEHDEL